MRIVGGLLRTTRLIRAAVDLDWDALKQEAERSHEMFSCNGHNTAGEQAFRVYNHPFD